jgi:hypothetical protein
VGLRFGLKPESGDSVSEARIKFTDVNDEGFILTIFYSLSMGNNITIIHNPEDMVVMRALANVEQDGRILIGPFMCHSLAFRWDCLLAP